mgnify:FL=1
MVSAINLLVNAVSEFWNSINETSEQKYRREMHNYLNQATDRLHLEQLEREWENKYGRRYW